MADTEVKRKGRPKRKEPDVVEAPKKAPVSNGDDAAPPAKRGRGRPPKAGNAAQKKAPVPGRGRGRPPKNNTSKKKPEVEDDDDDDDDDEKKESSDDAESS